MADRRLQVFSTVARLLSFTKAAEALHMTQPAVTFQIRQLEDYFNTRLFDRTHNRISLTTAGHLVKNYADQIISLYNEMDNEVRKLTGDVLGPLVLGASTTIGEYVIPSILGEYQAKFPDVAVRLHVANTEGVLHMVEGNEIDIGIVEGPVGNKNLVSKVCWDDELVVVTPPGHELTKSDSVSVEQIFEYPFISREEGSGTREVIQDHLQASGRDFSDLNLIMEFGSPESIKSAVAAGLGISVLSIATLNKELELGLLAKASLASPLKRPFSIVYQRQKFRLRAMDEFLEFTEAHCVQKQANA
ncbi:MAG: LysR family transcriptional regulator [Gammaproteobacteria bacterium]|jgi:DNA-binding transcriptional LysR family regulator|nr:LysR family transcriptional regulator [Gammaproteobacteria bacterium]